MKTSKSPQVPRSNWNVSLLIVAQRDGYRPLTGLLGCVPDLDDGLQRAVAEPEFEPHDMRRNRVAANVGNA